MSADLTLINDLIASFPELSAYDVLLFERYYRLILKWNDRLHLTTITRPKAFVERHLGESIFTGNRILPLVDEFWDIGSGAGLPGIPIAILRPEMEVLLVESDRKKVLFLEEVAAALELGRVRVINARFETIDAFSPQACLAARAVEKMERVVRDILRKGTGVTQILILGGAGLVVTAKPGWRLVRHSIPNSTNRWLFELVRWSAEKE